MTWIKLDDTLPNNPKILPLSDKAFRMYIEGLCYSNQYLTDGFLPDAIVRRLGNPIELIEAGLWLESDNGIQIHDYIKHQTSKKAVEEKRTANLERVMRYRDKSNADVTQPEYRIQKQNTETDTKGFFDEFWSVYPRKVGKQDALKVYARCLKKATAEQILEGAKRYANDPNRLEQYTAHPATWLNRGGWEDELLPKRLSAASLRLEQAPTPTPPRFSADEVGKPAPMPDSIKEIFGRV
jgi:hypothetical protein